MFPHSLLTTGKILVFAFKVKREAYAITLGNVAYVSSGNLHNHAD